MEHVNIAMYIKNYGRICCIFCIFCIFWYGGIFYILYILYCSVYRTRVEYCTFCVVRRSFQALFHITSSPHKHPFFLGVFTIIHHQSSSFITKCQNITCYNISSEQTMLLRSKLISINCKNTAKQCEKWIPILTGMVVLVLLVHWPGILMTLRI